MTEKNLRKALAAILANEDNPDFLRKLYNNPDLDNSALISKAVDELFSNKLLSYLNSHMEYIYNFNLNDEEFKNIVNRYDRLWAKEIGPFLTRIDEHKACPVSSLMIASTSTDGIMKDVYEETCFGEKGDVFVISHEVITLNMEIHLYRKIDAVPWSLADLEDEGFFPDKFNGFWTD